MFEIWKEINGRKSYIVAGKNVLNSDDLRTFAKRYFKVSAVRIRIQVAWIYKNELYLENPHKKAARTRLVAYL